MKQTLFLLLGYPGSGKSTFARQLAEATGAVRINSDDLRLYMFEGKSQIHDPANNPAVFGALDYVMERLLQGGTPVLCDANNNRYATRRKHVRQAQDCNAETIVLWVTTPLEIAKSRELERAKNPEHLPIPLKRYNEIAAALQEPEMGETVIRIDGLVSFSEQLQSFYDQLEKLL